MGLILKRAQGLAVRAVTVRGTILVRLLGQEACTITNRDAEQKKPRNPVTAEKQTDDYLSYGQAWYVLRGYRLADQGLFVEERRLLRSA